VKPQHAFVAERPLAQHCPQLLRAGPAPAELAGKLARSGDRLARALAAALAPLFAGTAPKVLSKGTSESEFSNLINSIAPLAANSLIGAGRPGNPLLASIDASAVLRLVERAFGGRGEAPAPLPAAFPVSAELMIGRLETAVCAAIAALSPETGLEISAFSRNGSIAELRLLESAAPLAVQTFEITEPGGHSFTLTLAFPQPALAALFGPPEHAPSPSARRPAHPAAEPFGEIPVTVSAVLVDMALSVSLLAKLRPGQVIPVAVARNVPLCIDGRTIAHGSVGEMDDRVAIQITAAF
jgi:flagellar motor switch protein FliM